MHTSPHETPLIKAKKESRNESELPVSLSRLDEPVPERIVNRLLDLIECDAHHSLLGDVIEDQMTFLDRNLQPECGSEGHDVFHPTGIQDISIPEMPSNQASAFSPGQAEAQTPGISTSPSTQLPEVLVTGSNAEPQKSDLSPAAAANPASVSVVKYPEEEKRDIQSYADLFRPITGISVSNFGQGGLGYGITVRGWPEGDHGHDIAYFVNVNELAHTNAPGSKKRKRHEEAQDLLNAGINVISTVNIEHLESLYNSVEQATGVVVRERVPDEVVMSADQIVTIDLPLEELLGRLQAGKIYPLERARLATRNVFHRKESRVPARDDTEQNRVLSRPQTTRDIRGRECPVQSWPGGCRAEQPHPRSGGVVARNNASCGPDQRTLARGPCSHSTGGAHQN